MPHCFKHETATIRCRCCDLQISGQDEQISMQHDASGGKFALATKPICIKQEEAEVLLFVSHLPKFTMKSFTAVALAACVASVAAAPALQKRNDYYYNDKGIPVRGLVSLFRHRMLLTFLTWADHTQGPRRQHFHSGPRLQSHLGLRLCVLQPRFVLSCDETRFVADNER